MRVLLVDPGPSTSVSDVYHGLAGGLVSVGAQVVPAPLGPWVQMHEHALQSLRPDLDDDERAVMALQLAGTAVRAAAWDARPDAIVVVWGAWLTASTWKSLRRSGIPLAVVLTESPYQDGEQARLAGWCDVALTNDRGSVSRLRDAGDWVVDVWGPCWDPRVHHRRGRRPERGVVIVGSGWPSRVDLLGRVDWTGIDVGLAGIWPLAAGHPLAGRVICGETTRAQTADLYRAAVSTLNLYRREVTPGGEPAGESMSPRVVEALACGCVPVTEPRPETDELLPWLPTVDAADPAGIGEALRWWSRRPAACDRVVSRSMRVLERRTWAHEAARLLRMLESVRVRGRS